MSAAVGTDRLTQAQGRIGTVIRAKWRVDHLVGVGGMAAVYAATHRNHQRAALKVLHAELSRDAEVRARFLREGYVANAVGHAGAVAVLDDDVTDDGAAYLVMDLLVGESLHARATRNGGKLPQVEVLLVAEALLEVLVAAHEKGIIHRDIKPENVFLTRERQVKLLDFGLAQVLESVSKLRTSSPEIVVGSPAFMSPEQAAGRVELVDARSDLFALGATLFALLSGRAVHPASNPKEQLARARSARAPSLSNAAPGVHEAIITIVDRALAFERDDRWPDAKTMLTSVREAKSQVGLAGRMKGLPESQRHPTSANPEHEVARCRAAVAEVQPKAQAAQAKVQALHGRLESLRAERKRADEQFQAKRGTQTSAVEEARHRLQLALGALGQAVIADGEHFGAEFEGARSEVQKLDLLARAAEEEQAIHRKALDAFDMRSMQLGLALMATAAIVVVLALLSPVILRFTSG